MPDDVATQLTSATAPKSGRGGRTQVLAFVMDADTEAVLRLGLLDAAQDSIVVHRGDSRSAVASMSKMPTPRADRGHQRR